MVRGQHDERLVELPELLEFVHDVPDLVVRCLRDEAQMRLLGVRAGRIRARVGDATPHVARLVDRAEREQHATPGLLLHHRHAGVRGPDVAAEVIGVAARREPVAVERIQPRGWCRAGPVGERPRCPRSTGCILRDGRGTPKPSGDGSPATPFSSQSRCAERHRHVACRPVGRVHRVVLLAGGDELRPRVGAVR